MPKLDEIALNIELVLISVIEGVALTKLAEGALPVFVGLNALQYIPYALAGLAILLVFWSQAILHAVSFIRWPLRTEHMFLYFIAAFVQVIAYGSIDDLASWFLWWTIFSVVAIAIYFIDLRMIREAAPRFAHLKGGPAFVKEVEERHIFEMKYLVPIAIAFNLICFTFAYGMPTLFDSPFVYATLGILQLLISLFALYDCMRNFKKRSAILPSLFESGSTKP